MIEKQGVDKKVLKYVSLIKENNYRLLSIINNLLDISKIDSKSFNLSYKKVDIVKYIKKLTLSVKDYIKDKNRIISLNTTLSEKYIECDPVRIERVFLNLVSNAIKFTSENDKIIISIWTDKKEEYIFISIKDTGIGIKKEKQDMIFKQFQQVDVSLSKNHEGAGLGLAIVKMIVDMHKGDIELKSKCGEGSEFIIKLPIKKAISEGNIYERQLDMDSIKMELSDL